ncbi:Rieske (2Fe-2S) protein [Bacteroidetes/Chlorobi group bacterium Naka2016]|nr:MAG: Rieske (2Fe-2S) protein [Bacteroidetes/Chlorobi group bacterium Naka2016]
MFMNSSRRKFLQKVTDLAKGIGVSLVFLPIFGCEKDWIIPPQLKGEFIEIDLTNEKSDVLNFPVLNFLGSGVTKQFEQINYGIPVIIVRVKKENKIDDFKCFSGMCTHDHCFGKEKVRAPIKLETVEANKKICRVVCTCHGSEFDLLNGGLPLKGPAEKPLREFKCEFFPETNILRIYY